MFCRVWSRVEFSTNLTSPSTDQQGWTYHLTLSPPHRQVALEACVALCSFSVVFPPPQGSESTTGWCQSKIQTMGKKHKKHKSEKHGYEGILFADNSRTCTDELCTDLFSNT